MEGPLRSAACRSRADEEHAESEAFFLTVRGVACAKGAIAIARARPVFTLIFRAGTSERTSYGIGGTWVGQRSSGRGRSHIAGKGPPGPPRPAARRAGGHRRAGHRAHCGRRCPLPAGQLCGGRRRLSLAPPGHPVVVSAVLAWPAPDRPPRRGHGRPSAHGWALAARAVPPRGGGRDAGRCGGCRPRGRGSGEDAQPLLGPPHLRGRDGRDPAPGRAVRGAAGDGQDLYRQGDGGGGRSAVLVRVLVRFPIDVLRADQPQNPFVLPCPAQLCPARGWRHRLHRGNRRHRRHPGRDGGGPAARASPEW